MKLIKSILFGTAVLAGVAAFGSQSDAAEIEHTVTSSDTSKPSRTITKSQMPI